MKTILNSSFTIILSLCISLSAIAQTTPATNRTKTDNAQKNKNAQNMNNMQTSSNMVFNGIANTQSYKTIELVNMDRNLSTFANLLALSGLGTSLALSTEPHTLIVPTNEAFSKMTIERFAELTNPTNKDVLAEFINNHYLNKSYQSADFRDTQEIFTGNNMSVNISRNANELSFGGANVVKADVKSANGTLYIVDNVLVPTSY